MSEPIGQTDMDDWINGCLAKKQFRTRSIAEEKAKQYRQRFKQRYRVYFCDDCRGYHLSTKPLT